MALEVIWSPEAERDLLHIMAFWLENNQSIEFPMKIQAKVEEVTSLLAYFPQMGEWATSGKWRSMIVLSHFSIVYLVSGNQLRVLRFWDTRQDPSHLSTPTA